MIAAKLLRRTHGHAVDDALAQCPALRRLSAGAIENALTAIEDHSSEIAAVRTSLDS